MPIINYFDPNTTATINETYTYSHVGATPEFAWILISAAALVLLALAFQTRIRDETGSINPSRIGFCLIGGVIGGCAAWLSLTIDKISGMGVTSTLVDNTTVVTAIVTHTIYEGGLLVIIFAACSILCFANLIYCLTLPEILKSDESEFAGEQNKARVKAERKSGGDEE